MADTFDVIEVEIAEPHVKRVMASDMSEADADAFIKMAVMRRGVDTHFYTTRPRSPR